MPIKLSKEKVLQIPALRAKGLSNEDIGKKLGVSKRLISHWVAELIKRGYEIKPQKAGRKGFL